MTSSALRSRWDSAQRPHTIVTVMAVANLWASASSLVLFALAARALSGPYLAEFALYLAASQFIVLAADAGATGLVIREIASSGSLGPVAWSARRRVLVTASLSTICGYVISEGDLQRVACFVVFCLFGSLYSLELAAYQGSSRYEAHIALQFLNGILFVSWGFLAYANAPSIDAFLLASGGSYSVLCLCGASMWRKSGIADKFKPGFQEQSHLLSANVANALTSSVDSFMLGWRSRGTLDNYALAQRPGLAFAALSNSISGFLLPRYARGDATGAKVRWLLYNYLGLVVGGALAGAAFTPLLDVIYGQTVEPVLSAILFAAYSGGLVATIASARVLADRGAAILSQVAWLQLATTALLITSLLGYGATGVAAGLLGGRVTGFSLLVLLPLRGRVEMRL